MRLFRFFLIISLITISQFAYCKIDMNKGGSTTSNGGLAGSIVKGIAGTIGGETVVSAAQYAAKYAAEQAQAAADEAKSAYDAAQAEADKAKADADTCAASPTAITTSYSNCGSNSLSASEACNLAIQKIYGVYGWTGVYGSLISVSGYSTNHSCNALDASGKKINNAGTNISCYASAPVDNCEAKKKAAVDLAKKAAAAKEAYEFLKKIADLLKDAEKEVAKNEEPKDCMPNDPRPFCKKLKEPPKPDFQYPCDALPPNVPCEPPNNKPDNCVIDDPRPACWDDYTKPKPCVIDDPRPECILPPPPPAGSGSCPICCDSSDPKYGGTAEQISGLRGDLARDRELSKLSASKMPKFKNDKRVGFSEGYEDGLKAAKITMCGGEDCSLTYCEKHPSDKDKCAHKEGMVFHELADYGTVNNTYVCACEAFEVDLGTIRMGIKSINFGKYSIKVHCDIMASIQSNLTIAMSLVIAITAVLIILSA